MHHPALALLLFVSFAAPQAHAQFTSNEPIPAPAKPDLPSFSESKDKWIAGCSRVFTIALARQLKLGSNAPEILPKMAIAMPNVVSLSESVEQAMSGYLDKFEPEKMGTLPIDSQLSVLSQIAASVWGPKHRAKVMQIYASFLDAFAREEAQIRQRNNPHEMEYLDKHLLVQKLKLTSEIEQKYHDRTTPLAPISPPEPWARTQETTNIPTLAEPQTPKTPGPPPNEIRDQILNSVKSTLGGWLSHSSNIAKLVDDIEDIALGRSNKASLSGVNLGVINHAASLVDQDAALASEAIQFYSTLTQLDSVAELKSEHGALGADERIMGPFSSINIWQVALNVTQGNPIRAFRILGIFGHDDQLQDLDIALHGRTHPIWLRTLNTFKPEMNSLLYRNGAMNGIQMSNRLQKKFELLKDEAKTLNRKHRKHIFGNADLPSFDESFRAGNYHIIAGAFVATELLLRGHAKFLGPRTPAIIAESLGGLYKLVTMRTKYMSPLQLRLYDAGYPKWPVAKPEGVSDLDFDEALYGIKLNLAFWELTQEQHGQGARMALDKVYEWARNQR